MPKEQSDPSDPMTLVGVALPASPGALEEMGRVFAEELLRCGFGPRQILEIFGDPHYRGPNQVFRVKGEQAVRAIIAEVARVRGPRADLPGDVGAVVTADEVAR